MYQIIYYDPETKRLDVEEYLSGGNTLELSQEIVDKVQALRDAGAPAVRVQYLGAAVHVTEIVRH